MGKRLGLLVLLVRFALHRRPPPDGGGDGPSNRTPPGNGNPPSPAEAVRPAQDAARERLTAGEPSGGGRRPGEGEPGRPPDEPGSTDADGDGEEGAFTTPQPVGEPKRRDDKWLKRNGVDPHEVKDSLPGPMSHYDLYVDRDGNIWAVRKGANPRSGEYVGNMDDYAD
jgi:hypothetical protein